MSRLDPSGAAYQLARPDAVERIGVDRLRYRLLLRPQAIVRPDEAWVAVTAPVGWTFTALRPRARLKDTTASWSATLDREHHLEFALSR